VRQAKVDFWITGHDHDLQHIEFAGHPTSFVISGGGGAELVNWTTDPAQRGPFGSKVLGFSDLEISDGAVILRHIDVNGQELHAFRKTSDGKVTLLKPLGSV
jgi:tartrate-resistant acid phosphatase type 5